MIHPEFQPTDLLNFESLASIMNTYNTNLIAKIITKQLIKYIYICDAKLYILTNSMTYLSFPQGDTQDILYSYITAYMNDSLDSLECEELDKLRDEYSRTVINYIRGNLFVDTIRSQLTTYLRRLNNDVVAYKAFKMTDEQKRIIEEADALLEKYRDAFPVIVPIVEPIVEPEAEPEDDVIIEPLPKDNTEDEPDDDTVSELTGDEPEDEIDDESLTELKTILSSCTFLKEK